MSDNKLAIFDIDGTIANHGVVADKVLDGIRNLHKLGYYTTVCTGRGYLAMKHALGDIFEEIISDGTLISLEHGTKVVHKNGEVFYADYFKEEELEHVIDFVKSNLGLIQYLWFRTPNPLEGRKIWCKNSKQIEEVVKGRTNKTEQPEVFHCEFSELLEKFKAQPLSSIATKLESNIKVENLKLHFTRSEIDVIFQDGTMEFIRNVADKAKSINKMEEFLKIPNEKMLIAGNAINDVEMLNIPAGQRILVGTDENSNNVLEHLTDKHNVVRLDTPEHLGEFLQSLKDF